MLTVMYDDDMPDPDELGQLADSLQADGSLDGADAERAARVLRAVAAGLKQTFLSERISDEGFD